MSVKRLTEFHLEFLSLKGGCTGSSESTLVKMPHCWKSHVTAQLFCLYAMHDIIFSIFTPPVSFHCINSCCCLLGNSACFLLFSDFFSILRFFENYFRNKTRVSNSLDPDQTQHFVRPDLGPKCLQRLATDNHFR